MATHTVLTSRIDRITALKKRLGLSKASKHGEVCFIYHFTLRTCLLLCFQGVFHILLNHYSRRGVTSAATKNCNFYLGSLLTICNNTILSRVLLSNFSLLVYHCPSSARNFTSSQPGQLCNFSCMYTSHTKQNVFLHFGHTDGAFSLLVDSFPSSKST